MFKNTITISILIIGIMLVLWSCNEEGANEPIPNETTEEKIANNLVVLNGAGNVYKDTLTVTQDSISALNAMGQWIVSQENVKEAYYNGPNVVEIYFKNGLRSSMLLIPTDENGRHLLRGGGLANHLSEFNFKTQSNSTKKIKNNKVLVLNPYSKEFEYGDYSRQLELFKSADEKFDVTVVSDGDFDLDVINTFGDYGFIILNTHGIKNGFMVNVNPNLPAPGEGTEWQTDELLKVVKSNANLPLDKLENGELELAYLITTRANNVRGGNYQVLVSEEYIRKVSIDLTDAVLFGNHCFSGHTIDGPTTNNMAEAWRSKGLATYYGYSRKDGQGIYQSDAFCQAMEDSLIINLAKNTDTTGIAHLSHNSTAQFYNDPRKFQINQRQIKYGKKILYDFIPSEASLYFNQYFDKNYKYGFCDDKPAYMSAEIDGILPSGTSLFIDSSGTSQQIRNEKSIALQGNQVSRRIELTTTNYTGPKTYTLGGSASDWQATLFLSITGTPKQATSGEITIVEDNGTCMIGTFSFLAGEDIIVKNGKFLVKF